MFKEKHGQKFNIWRLVVINFILRLVYIFVFTTPDNYLITDMGAYNERALNLVAGNPRPFPNYWAPFFHIFLSIIYWPLKQLDMMDYKVRLVVVILAVLGSFTVFFVYKITSKLFSEKSARIAAIITTLWYPLVYLNIFLLSENLFIPLLYLGLYIYFCRKDWEYSDLLLGVVWGMAVLTRPLILIFIGFFVLWLLFQKRYRFVLGFLTAFCLIMLNMSIYNRVTTNNTTTLISSGNSVNFVMQWCDTKSIEYNSDGVRFGFAPPANHEYDDDKRRYTEEPFYNEGYYYKMGLNCIKEDPERIVTGTRSIKNLFHSELFPHFYNIWASRELYLPFKLLNVVFLLLSVFSIYKYRQNLFKKEIVILP